MKRLIVDVPQVSLDGGKEHITLVIGGTIFMLVGDNTQDVRGLAIALHTAKCITLEVEESSFRVPETFK